MNSNFQSSQSLPILYFKEVIDFAEIDKFKLEFFNKWKAHAGAEVINEESCIVHFLADDEFNTPIPTKVYFEDELDIIFREQFFVSKHLIDSRISEIVSSNHSPVDFLNWLLNDLEALRVSSTALFNKYSICRKPIIKLQEHISSSLELFGVRKEINEVQKQAFEDYQSNDKLINDIFSFMQGSNEDGQRIMSESEYKRMIKYIKALVEYDKFEVDKKIARINITNDLLRYCFYILNKRINGRRVNEKYILFLRNVFIQLTDITEKTLKTKFSVRPGYFPSFVPHIVKQQ